MAYITPSSKIKFLRGIDIDSNYDHTIWFDTKTEQYNFFASHVKPTTGGYSFTIDDSVYQRHDGGSLRVGIPADYLMDCNYIMFQNTAYGDKWFYAFMGKPVYENDGCCIVPYEIDNMQTWLFDYELGECFVEREHTATEDDRDSLLIPENLDGGDAIIIDEVDYDAESLKESGDPSTCILINYVPNNKIVVKPWTGSEHTFQPDDVVLSLKLDEQFHFYVYDLTSIDASTRGLFANNTFSGSVPLVLRLDETVGSHRLTNAEKGFAISGVIEVLTANKASIISMQLVPYYICKSIFLSDSFSEITKTVNRPTAFKSISAIGTAYTPKNAKLLQYPYMFAIVCDNNGNSMGLKWEDSSQSFSSMGFKIQGVAYPKVEMSLIPSNRRGTGFDYQHAMALSDFPSISWSEDSFARWWAQNKTTFGLSLISGVLSGASFAATVATGNPVFAIAGQAASQALVPVSGGAVSPVLGTPIDYNVIGMQGGSPEQPEYDITRYKGEVPSLKILNVIGGIAKQYNMPDVYKSQSSADTLKVINGKMGFTVYLMGITAERAKILDKYLTMFGYTAHKVKVPNRNVRANHTYVQTKGCLVHAKYDSNGNFVSGVPATVESAIAAVYDKGITFWNKNAKIGDYSVANPVNPT